MTTRTIGIAGFSGSGKSTAAAYLQNRLRAPLINADHEAKLFMASNQSIIEQLCTVFGPQIYTDEILDFKLLGTLAFATVESIKSLNAIVHPPFLIHLKKMVAQTTASTLIVDAALIKLWQIEPWFTHLIWIDAPTPLRIERTMQGGFITPAAALQRAIIQEQLFAPPKAHPWVHLANTGSLADLYTALDRLHFEGNTRQ